MLTAEQIRFLIERVSEETVVPPSPEFPYKVSRPGRGYSADPQIGAIQAALSILLERALAREARDGRAGRPEEPRSRS